MQAFNKTDSGLLFSFFVDPAADFFDILQRDIAHVSDAESLVFQVAVAVADNQVMFGLKD